MSELRKIKGSVVHYSMIPEGMPIPDFVEEASSGVYVECHIDDEGRDALDNWLIELDPSLEDETFYIYMDRG
jgi:hypothetical protein